MSIDAVRALHHEEGIFTLRRTCADGECEHEDECPTDTVMVCAECFGLRSDIDDESERLLDRSEWPCDTIKALDA